MSTGGDGVGSAGVWDGEGEGVRCGTMLTGGNGMGSAGVWDVEGEGAGCGTVSTGGDGMGSAGVWNGEGEGVRCVVVGSSEIEAIGRAGDDVTTENGEVGREINLDMNNAGKVKCIHIWISNLPRAKKGFRGIPTFSGWRQNEK